MHSSVCDFAKVLGVLWPRLMTKKGNCVGVTDTGSIYARKDFFEENTLSYIKASLEGGNLFSKVPALYRDLIRLLGFKCIYYNTQERLFKAIG